MKNTKVIKGWLREELIDLKVITPNKDFNDNEWGCLNYLIRDDLDLQNFIKIYGKNRTYCLSYVLAKYREYVREIKVDSYKAEELETLYANNQFDELRGKFENIFTSFIKDNHMDYFLLQMKRGKINLNGILDYHIKYQNRHFMCALVK